MLRILISYIVVIVVPSIYSVPLKNIDSEKSQSKSADVAPLLSNFASDKNQKLITTTSASKMVTENGDGKSTMLEHKLLNVPIYNGTGTIFLNINLKKMMEDPYVHGIVLPAAVGIIVALLTLMLICSIRSCIRSRARKLRRRRIRNLAEELKSDQKKLLTTAADSDDEI